MRMRVRARVRACFVESTAVVFGGRVAYKSKQLGKTIY